MARHTNTIDASSWTGYTNSNQGSGEAPSPHNDREDISTGSLSCGRCHAPLYLLL